MVQVRSVLQFGQLRFGTRWVPLAISLFAVAPGCMSSPRHGQQLPRMGAPVGFIAAIGPQQPMVFQYAVHEKGPSGYSVVGWKTLGTCTTSSTFYTDVQNVQWGLCSISTQLPTSDCTFGGQGAWRGNPSNPNDGQRFMRVRAIGNGFPVFSLPVTLSDSTLSAHIAQYGGLSAAITFNAGVEAVVSAPKPQFGVADLVGSADTTDVFGTGDRVYVTRTASAAAPEFAILDVSNPGSPTLLGSLELGVTVHAVFVEGNYAYLAAADDAAELRVVDVSHPSSPVQIASVLLPETADAISVAAVGGMVYVGRANNSGGEFHVLRHDLANPGSVAPPYSYEVGADVNAIDVTGDFAYLATNHSTKKFIALDVSDPSDVVEQSSVSLGGGAALDVDYHAGRLYGVANASAGPDFFILSAPPGGPLSVLGSLRLGTNNTGVSVYNRKALVSSASPTAALTVVDVATASAPTLVGSAAAAAPAVGLAVRNGIATLATTGDSSEAELLSAGVPLERVIADVNGGGVTIGCIGDSNTGTWCSKANDCFQSDTASASPWCADPGTVWAQRPSWHTQYHSTGFGAMSPIWSAPGCCVMDGSEQISQALCEDLSYCQPGCFPDHPICTQCPTSDAVVFALGTVDTGNAACPGSQDEGNCQYVWPYPQGDIESILQNVQGYAAQAEAAGVTPFYVLVPPIEPTFFQGVPGCPNWGFDFSEMILKYNNRIRHEVPRELIVDFFSPMVIPDDYVDAAHMSEQGQQKRARAALSKLKN